MARSEDGRSRPTEALPLGVAGGLSSRPAGQPISERMPQPAPPGNQQREPICHETRMPQFSGNRAWPGCSWWNTLPEITLVDRLAAVRPHRQARRRLARP
jgi:hypothetical protein